MINDREHDLKVWPEFFDVIASGEKTFEIRRDDRGFRAGDILHLREWDRSRKEYTGRSLRRTVSYITAGAIGGLTDGYVCMGLSAQGTEEDREALELAWAVIERLRHHCDPADIGLLRMIEEAKDLRACAQTRASASSIPSNPNQTRSSEEGAGGWEPTAEDRQACREFASTWHDEPRDEPFPLALWRLMAGRLRARIMPSAEESRRGDGTDDVPVTTPKEDTTDADRDR